MQFNETCRLLHLFYSSGSVGTGKEDEEEEEKGDEDDSEEESPSLGNLLAKQPPFAQQKQEQLMGQRTEDESGNDSGISCWSSGGGLEDN